jgi:hypothetical protein
MQDDGAQFLKRKPQQDSDEESNDSEVEQLEVHSSEEEEDFEAARASEFGQKAINNEPRLLERLNEIR